MACHYGTVVIPARVRRPRDKAKVESAVGVVERPMLAPLRDRTFFSLAELNVTIRELLADLNERPFQKLDGSRRSLFEELDRPALRTLPEKRYEFAEWRKARVNVDYHIEVNHNYYSVPYTLVRKEVEVRSTLGTVEVFFRGRRVASHIRAHGRGRFVTLEEHMPEAHRRHRERPSRLTAQAFSRSVWAPGGP